jgi:nucleotide-binding universal stress UspA family protein
MANERKHLIVVPLDGSPFAEHALGYAAAIARATGARLRLVLVHQLREAPIGPEGAQLYAQIEVALRKSERSYLRELARRLRERSKLEVTVVSPDGPVTPALLRYLDESDPDLVVMSTHGRGAAGRALLGSVADRVVREAKVPVLLVRPGDASPPLSGAGWSPGEILVPLDGSEAAETALDPAADLAGALGGRLTLVQVVVPVAAVTDPPLAFAGDDSRLTDIRRREAQDYLDGIAERLRERGVTVGAAAVVGAGAASVLKDLSGEGCAGLIVIASHGRGRVRRLALGSVADRLVRTAEVPVLVVRREPLAATG